MKKLILLSVTLIFSFLVFETKAQCPVKAGFNYSINNGYKVVFSSSQSPQKHFWTFGSNNGTGNTYNPTYTYPGSGIYSVCHYVSSYDSSTRKTCSDTICRKITIPAGCSANAFFKTTVSCDSVQFRISKQNSNKVFWGDGSSTNNAYSVWHKYKKAGTYTICHIASGYDSSTRKYCEDTICKKVTITSCTACNLDATFSENHSGGGRHYFIPKNKIGKHYWSFGDGNNSQTTTPVHTYKRTGSYTVCHILSYYDSTTRKHCSDTSCKTIKYGSSCPANAKFNLYDSGLTIYYSGIKHYNNKWIIANNVTRYHTSGSYTFKAAGTYNICHIAKFYDSLTRNYCYDTVCKTITVGKSSCNLDASFSVSHNSNGKYLFSPKNRIGSHYWSFGDGNNSQITGPIHTYKRTGTYTVCHKISYYDSTNRKWCSDSTCKTIKYVLACNANASFSLTVDKRNTAKFTSRHPYASNHWNFNNGAGTSKLGNPSYTFKKAGKYLVCHVVSYYDTSLRKHCYDSTCQWVNINACNANAFFNPKVNGLTATFYDFKPNASHKYTFGDGNSSTKSNPTHTYKKAGYYTVCHYLTEYDSINNQSCSDSSCQTIYFRSNKPCDASFQVFDSSGYKYFYSTNISHTAKHSWQFGDGNSSSKKDPIHTYRKKGTYTVCHKVTEYDSNNRIICQDTVCKKVVNGITSITDNDIKSSLNVYPNPANQNLFIEFAISSREDIVIRILNPLGQVEFTKEIEGVNGKNKLSIPLSTIQNGMHFIQIQSEDGQSTKAFIKQ